MQNKVQQVQRQISNTNVINQANAKVTQIRIHDQGVAPAQVQQPLKYHNASDDKVHSRRSTSPGVPAVQDVDGVETTYRNTYG